MLSKCFQEYVYWMFSVLLSFVFHPGFEHGHPATFCDQVRDPRPCSLHGGDVCSCYWLHWHHRKPPSSLCILQVPRFHSFPSLPCSLSASLWRYSAWISSWVRTSSKGCCYHLYTPHIHPCTSPMYSCVNFLCFGDWLKNNSKLKFKEKFNTFDNRNISPSVANSFTLSVDFADYLTKDEVPISPDYLGRTVEAMCYMNELIPLVCSLLQAGHRISVSLCAFWVSDSVIDGWSCYI